MKYVLLILLVTINLPSFAQTNGGTLTNLVAEAIQEELTHKLFSIETDKIYDKLLKIRRDFYQTSELAGNEKRTQLVIKQYLLYLGLQVDTNIYGHSIIGILPDVSYRYKYYHQICFSLS
jgi:hypothetical protein